MRGSERRVIDAREGPETLAAGLSELGKLAGVAGRVGRAPDTSRYPSDSAAGDVDSPRPRVHVWGGPHSSCYR